MVSRGTAIDGEELHVLGYLEATSSADASSRQFKKRAIFLRGQEVSLLGCRPIFGLGLLI